MTDAAIATHLTQIEKPLQYAIRHNFAHLPTLRDLERYVQHHLQALQVLTLPAAMRQLLQQLAHTVQDFDTLPLPEKQERLRQLQRVIVQMRAVLQPPPAASQPSQEPPAAGADDPLVQPVQFVRGVGPKRAALLQKLHVQTVHDLLWCLPLRYEDRRQITPLGLLRTGTRETFRGTVVTHSSQARPRGKPVFAMLLQDESGPLTCKWFQTRPTYLQERFPVGTRVVGSGMITLNAYNGSREVIHPDLEVIADDDADLLHVGRVVPVYPLTAGLPQKTMRTLMKHVVDTYAAQVPETLPEAMRHAHALPLLSEALRQVHFPDAAGDVERLNTQETPFHRRLIFEEFFLLELGLALRHRMVQQEQRIAPYHLANHLGEALLQHLPFHLTAAQHRVLFEILEDMQRPFPMHRLIQGDVGSGKTVVALLAMLMAVSNGFQAALMAPTEILAEQHLHTLQALLQPLELEVGLLTSAIKGKNRQELLGRIAQGEISLIVGTHALLYDEVQFHRLGMIVVDEQHRFGVLQRARLRQKGLTPDVLVMTATPIPRTLAMTLYGDLDLSVIDALPPDRLPVHTTVLSAARRERAYDAVRREVT